MRKFSDYLSMMLICPVLFIMSSSFAIFLTTQVRIISEKIALLGVVTPFILVLVDFSPYIIIWILFTFTYMFMPNMKVRFSSALLAGVLAGTAFQIVQYGYLHFQVGVAQYNAIYGSFAALPLFFVWMQISWLVVLFGAELSFAHHHSRPNRLASPKTSLSRAQEHIIALLVTHLLTQRFKRGEPPMQAPEISSQLGIPITYTEDVLRLLCETGLICAVDIKGASDEGYQPGQDISALTIHQVLEAMDNSGSGHIHIQPTPAFEKLTQALSAFSKLMRSAPTNQCLKDI